MINFSIGPEIKYGNDPLAYLERLNGRQILIVTDPSMVRLGVVKSIEDRVKKAGIPYQRHHVQDHRRRIHGRREERDSCVYGDRSRSCYRNWWWFGD